MREEGSILWIMFLLDGMPFKLEYLKRVLDRLRRSECVLKRQRRSSRADYEIAMCRARSVDAGGVCLSME